MNWKLTIITEENTLGLNEEFFKTKQELISWLVLNLNVSEWYKIYARRELSNRQCLEEWAFIAVIDGLDPRDFFSFRESLHI
tara:strand:- start:5523 stop:5768 length:246 start_codon:yes stop_codon:yes gene_type:complete